jgi:hypothetical protein
MIRLLIDPACAVREHGNILAATPHLSHSPITMSYVPKIVMMSEIK